jgi:hypothetical protein
MIVPRATVIGKWIPSGKIIRHLVDVPEESDHRRRERPAAQQDQQDRTT